MTALERNVADHMWWTSKGWDDIGKHGTSDTHHPNQAAPLCAPCNYARNTSELPFPQPNGCPCTPELLCAADHKGMAPKLPVRWAPWRSVQGTTLHKTHQHKVAACCAT